MKTPLEKEWRPSTEGLETIVSNPSLERKCSANPFYFFYNVSCHDEEIYSMIMHLFPLRLLVSDFIALEILNSYWIIRSFYIYNVYLLKLECYKT